MYSIMQSLYHMGLQISTLKAFIGFCVNSLFDMSLYKALLVVSYPILNYSNVIILDVNDASIHCTYTNDVI